MIRFPSLFLALALALACGPLPAQQAQPRNPGINTAVCTSGQGCKCNISAMTLDSYELLLQQKPPEGAADMVLVNRGDGGLFWTDRNFDQIHRTFGGRGPCTIDLFPGEAGPADGIWEFTETATDYSRCPLLTSGVAGISPTDLMSGTGPVIGRKEIRWGNKFDVRKYMHAASHGNWHQVDPHTWEFRVPQLEMLPAESPVSIKISWRSTLASSTRIQGRFHYVSRMDIPGAAAVAALANTHCELNSSHTGRWIGPLPGAPDPRSARESEF